MLKPDEVLVWRARLDEIPADTLPPLLPAEAERAARYHSDEARRRYTRSHGVLRMSGCSRRLARNATRTSASGSTMS